MSSPSNKSLASTLEGMQAKLAWSYICQSSLWAEYMRSKYEGFARRGSCIWRSINLHVPGLRQHAFWIFGNGETKVDKVLGVYDIEPNPNIGHMSIAQLGQAGRTSELKELLPEHARDAVEYSPGKARDQIVWAYNSYGKFCIKTYLRLKHIRAPSPLSHIWHEWIPPKVSIFAWRVGKGAISTDDRVKSLGIQLASKCTCCSAPSCETVEHLFLHGDVASMVWDHFNKACMKPRAHSLFQLFKYWATDSNPRSQFGVVSISIFLWSLWEIWKLRNKARHDGASNNILRVIQHNVNLHTGHVRPRTKASSKERTMLQSLHMEIKEPLCKPPAWVAWTPGNGITANLIVSSDAKKGSLILRDPFGSFISGFVIVSDYHCRATNLLSLLDRTFECCASRNISIMEAQMSDKNVVRWMHSSTSKWPWSMTKLLRRCKVAAENTRIVFIPKVVNSCAKALLKGKPGWFDAMESLPREVKACLRLEASKMPYCVRGSDLAPVLVDPG